MKITTLEINQWNPSTEQYETVHEESYEYEGPVDEAKGQSAPPSTTTQTTTSKPFGEQLPFVTRVFDEAQQLFEAGPQQFFPGETVTPFSAETEAALAGQTALAAQLPGFLAPQTTALTDLLRTPDPANDPTVQAFADAAVRPLEQQLTEQILPQIGSQAVAQGAFGGSRQQLLEQQAARDFTRAAGDVRAGIFNNAFEQQLAAQQRALALSPQVLQSLSTPTQLLSEVGAARENLAQQQLDAQRERFEFEQIAPLVNLQQFSNLINQFGGQSVAGTSIASAPSAQRSRLTGALGGAATGASIGSVVPGIGTAIGAGVGGLIGLLGG